MFEILEHTADIGFRAEAETRAGLFEAAAEALVAVTMEAEGIEARDDWRLEAGGSDDESLMVNWLNEVLWLIDGKRMALARFEVTQTGEGRVAGKAWGEPFDPARHRAKVIVKGVTYHQIEVGRDGGRWRARVFLDI